MAQADYLEIVYVTDDFDNGVCFEVGECYVLEYREPSTPGVPTGIALTRPNIFGGWVRERCRDAVEDSVSEGKLVKVRVESIGRSWSRYDHTLQRRRVWQLGEVSYWTDEDSEDDRDDEL
ncbi:hypothetical protein E4U22_001274 [Claviceps purpurea]|nr:hypothetical protein E4U24_000587 [Claviceps purpurea]KAG6313080.1 hypothetical protein E4U22_001274 [Claviceps purpurea]